MEEFVDGYMKIHTQSNGKRRWSRKVSLFQTVSEDDLEKLRQKMDSVIGKPPNDKKPEEKDAKENKDDKTAATKNDEDKTKSVNKEEKKVVENIVKRKNSVISVNGKKTTEDNKSTKG